MTNKTRRNAPRGFTLLEMMIVVLISLLIMAVIVPIFKLTTHTVQAVERKLAIYESARNILDNLAYELKQSVANERGGLFCIKKYRFMDKDPFTPPQTNLKNRFYESRREADAVFFTLHQAGGFRFNKGTSMAGSMSFPMAYPQWNMMYPEGWRASFRSSLFTRVDGGGGISATDGDYDSGYYSAQDSDVSLIEFSGCYESLSNVVKLWQEGPPAYTQHVHHYDPQFFDDLSPGRELMRPYQSIGTAMGNQKFRKVSTTRCMDIEFAWWDDTKKAFTILPDYEYAEAIYFAPIPKAVRVTITVCDPNRRGRVTLSRVVSLPSGTGYGAIYRNASSKGDRDFLNKSDSDFTPAPYNRVKNLGALEPTYGSYP
jgi:prepilin-type N-terminal cleavage/methylation domain-containing protein